MSFFFLFHYKKKYKRRLVSHKIEFLYVNGINRNHHHRQHRLVEIMV